MTAITHEPRYTIEQAPYGWDVIDSQTGESVGVCPGWDQAAKTLQRLNALHLANSKRIDGARFKKAIAGRGPIGGAEELIRLLRQSPPPDNLATLRIFDALMAVKAVGSSKASKMIACIGVHAGETRRVGDLTPRQCSELARLLGEHAEQYTTNLAKRTRR